MSYLFKSERLGFRAWQTSDHDPMIAISSNPVVMEFFPYLATAEQTVSFINRMNDMLQRKGYCYFAVDVLETKEFIGFIGLCDQDFEASFTPCTDIGWRLSPQHWGNGYATEGASACLDYAFDQLNLAEVVATAPKANVKSINVMQKIGMRHHLDFTHPKCKDDELLKDAACYLISNPN